MPAAERLVMGIPLDITTVNEADLDKVPGIGPALARRIVLYRQKNGGSMTVQDLLLVEGIGEKKFKTLRKFF
jgi:competence protein ComEA